jgi:hypothetical protein
VTPSIAVFENVLGTWNVFIAYEAHAGGLPPGEVPDVILWNQTFSQWKSAGPITFGIAAGPCGGGWGYLSYLCAPGTCPTCDDGTPLQYILTAGSVTGSPFTLQQGYSQNANSEWLGTPPGIPGTPVDPAPGCGCYACIYGIGDQTLAPITPLSNPIFDWSSVDTQIAAKPNLTLFPFANPANVYPYPYAFIDDFKIHWFLSLNEPLPVSADSRRSQTVSTSMPWCSPSSRFRCRSGVGPCRSPRTISEMGCPRPGLLVS